MSRREKHEVLVAKITELKSLLESERSVHTNELETERNTWGTERQDLEEEIKSLKEDIEEKKKALNERELKKLAQAYREQERGFTEEADTWLVRVGLASGGLALSVVFSAIYAHNYPWYERFEYYIINFIFITLLVFALKQYSLVNRLRIDFANRKTLAQSYQNIISTTEDEDIKDQFLKEATKVLCAPTDPQTDSYTIPEKIIDGVVEIGKNLSSKVTSISK